MNYCAPRLTVLVLAATMSGALSGCATASLPSTEPRASTSSVQVVASVGWKWGGDWTALKDFQHFSANDY